MVDILLATYNGDRYLEEQLDSLLNQQFGDWRLLVRDDGSSDKTVALLNAYAKKCRGRIVILPNCGTRLGASGNFFELMRNSAADHVMLCDQDDIWMPEKIADTLEKMREMEATYGRDIPLLVHTDFKVVDDNLKVLADSGWRYQKTDPRRTSLNRLLVQNIVTGATVMLNSRLRDLILPPPSGHVMHDFWLALVAGAFGRIGYIPEPLLFYRQHGINTVGAKSWGGLSSLKKLSCLADVRGALLSEQRQAGAFLERYHDLLSSQDRLMVQAYARLGEKGFFEKRYCLLKNGFFHAGFLRKAGMFLFC